MGAGNGRILVVDDERINRLLLSTNLEESGYDVETAVDGQEALELLKTKPFDVELGIGVLSEEHKDQTIRITPNGQIVMKGRAKSGIF